MVRRDVLELTPLLNGVVPKELDTFSSFLNFESFADGHILFREGDPGTYMCIVGQGSVGIAKAGKANELKIMWELGKGKVFGELALFDGQPRSGAAVCIGPTELYFLTREEFVRLAEEFPGLALRITENVIKVLSNNLRTTTARFLKAADALNAKTRR